MCNKERERGERRVTVEETKEMHERERKKGDK